VSLLWLALATGCQVDTYALRKDYAGPPALPAEVAARFAYPAPDPAAPEPEFELLGETEAFRHKRARFEVLNPAAGGRTKMTLEVFESRVGEGRRPAVLIMPILAGRYPECAYLGGQFTGAGMHAFFVHREDNLLDPARRGPDMERVLRKSVIACRQALDYMAARPDVDPERLGFIGISLGAILGTSLVAVEPRLKASVFLMGGADLSGIVLESRESPVRWYRNRRMSAEGLEPEDLRREIADSIVSDPEDLAPFVDARRVLLFIAKYDNKVPSRYQWLLWERMGRPDAYACPCGHYTAIFYLDFAREKVLAFYRRAFGLDPAPGPTPESTPAQPVTAAGTR